MDPKIEVRLLKYTNDAPKIIAVSSKITLSKKSLDNLLEISENEINIWISETYRRFHLSPWEHISYTFVIDGLSRIASHQLVRHRIASYTQMSHRHTEGFLRKLVEEASKTININCEDSGNRYGCYSRILNLVKQSPNKLEIALIGFVPPRIQKEELEIWAESVLESTSKYYLLLSKNISLEEARYVLPDSVRTRIIVTMNARELIQSFLPLRMCSKAQWEIRYIAWKLWEELMKIHPQIWKYAGPSCVLRENTTRYEPKSLLDYLSGKEKFTIERCPELIKNAGILYCLKNSMNF
ncbi:MAG: FAD-dependent thymidylate synthase [Nanopusillaceae archaeon]